MHSDKSDVVGWLLAPVVAALAAYIALFHENPTSNALAVALITSP